MWPANPTMTCFIAAGYYATANCGAGWQPAEIHVELETLEGGIPAVYAKAQPDYRFSAAILLNLIRRLRPLGRQFILLYLKGEGSETIADVTGLSATNI